MAKTLHAIVDQRKAGKPLGLPSYCTANLPSLRAIMRTYAKRWPERPLLIEATANQVNQFGGYTGMKPVDYRAIIEKKASECGLSLEQLILGGDHLGPLTWQQLPEEEAMAHAHELLRQFTAAGFKKIHLDTSMRLGSDDPGKPLPVEVCARRGAELFHSCLEVLKEQQIPESEWPEFVIGSEVPVPGGVSGMISSLEVTKAEAFEETLKAYREAFARVGVGEAFKHVVAVVVQPGVEYSDHNAAVYRRDKAIELMNALKREKGLMFEGHSTDYQPLSALREMIEDGVGILKVGPMITFAYREALYALAEMEKWLVPGNEASKLIEVCENVLCDDPSQWQKYYHGVERELLLARHFSYSDRIRYYLPRSAIDQAIQKLMQNLRTVKLPQTLLSQYLPLEAELGLTEPEALIDAHIARVCERYEAATHPEMGEN
ncbi:MAG: class II D-tagatose-bisphosphate aldolase, non-catalytic subunit [Clostridiales bacterium]|nr:class II D-tagatose-bisphosphate aldolase, non-catalytic subunit [Clostridiales bacterium]MDD7432574.1 class II D-tagatose-bisphosphate aldolase, non-catalytic subunit [Clostridiales bacterium]MDY3062151.1 class II D-tagatose-bisphosphate aldolase, non-catalytic subunit [Eubacteriales bacterium]